MIPYINYLFLPVIFFFLSGCGGGQHELKEWMAPNGRIKALATTAMIADLVREVGGEQVDVIVLIKGDLDPHSYQLVKGDGEKLSRSDIIFANGLGLEHGPSLQSYLESHPKVKFLGSRLLNEVPDEILCIQGQTDPHVWMDAALFSRTIPLIVEGLSELRPEKSLDFQERGGKLQQELLTIDQSIRDELHQVPQEKRYLVTSHDAFNYFTRTYLAEPGERESGEWSKRFAAPEGLSPDSQLSTKDIADILEHVERYRIRVIFPESNVSSDSLKKIKNAGFRTRDLKLCSAIRFFMEMRWGRPALKAALIKPC